MISEEQQDRAALYALGSLDADEAAAFEREMADQELAALAADLREAAAALARTDTGGSPPPALRARVLARAEEEIRHDHPTTGKVIAGPWGSWVPWAAAAALAVCCGALSWKSLALDHRMPMDGGAASSQNAGAGNGRATALRQVVFCALEPVPEAARAGPQAAVLWDAAHRRGTLHLTGLPPAREGEDYQLWTVEDGRKDPASAGVVKVGADHRAEVEFQPVADDGKAPVVAFALSRERAGGVPKNEGPILFLGKLSP